MKLESKQIGMLVALVLGIVMLFLPAQDSKKYRFDPGTIAKSIEESEDHIDPSTLSQWLIEGRQDFMLIDIRTPGEFEQGHIKGAKNIPLAQLLEKDTLQELPGEKYIILYSNGSSHAAQAWLVMNTAGFDSYMLEGGFNYWNKVIMNPNPPSGQVSDDEILRYKTQVAVKNYFSGGTAAGANPVVPDDKIKKKPMIRKSKKKKKLKGC